MGPGAKKVILSFNQLRLNFDLQEVGFTTRLVRAFKNAITTPHLNETSVICNV